MERKPFRILEHVDLHDEGMREEIRQLVEAVAHWCRRVRPEEPVGTQSVAAPYATLPVDG